jgi:hypothetical protein
VSSVPPVNSISVNHAALRSKSKELLARYCDTIRTPFVFNTEVAIILLVRKRRLHKFVEHVSRLCYLCAPRIMKISSNILNDTTGDKTYDLLHSAKSLNSSTRGMESLYSTVTDSLCLFIRLKKMVKLDKVHTIMGLNYIHHLKKNYHRFIPRSWMYLMVLPS